MRTVSTHKPRRFLALGDSYTIGEGVTPSESWPMQLSARLHEMGIAIEDPEIVATTGWSTDELSAVMKKTPPHGPYALVTLLIGVNNQYRGRDVINYRLEFTDLLEHAILLAEKRSKGVIVVSIPDWGVTAFARAQGRDPQQVAREIDTFNNVNRDVAARYGASWVDVTSASRSAGMAVDQLVDDGLHPAGKQYASWTALILPVAERLLR